MIKRIGIAFLVLILLIAQTLLVTASVPASLVTGDKISVLDHGAKGDGKTDDTAAFQKAINKAAAAKKPVYVPAGTYVLKHSLELKDTALIGQYAGSFAADKCTLPNLLISNTGEPAIRMNNATLSGVQLDCFFGSADAAVKATENIAVEGNNCRIYNLRIRGCGTGIRVNKSGVTGLEVVNLFIADPYATGLDIRNTKGTVLLKNIEVWSASTRDQFLNSGGVGFLLENNETVHMEATCVFAAYIAYDFKGTNTVRITNGCADFSSIGLRAGGSSDVTVTGGTYWAHHMALQTISNAATVKITGTDMCANGNAVVNLLSAKSVEICNSNLRRQAANFNFPAAAIEKGVKKAVLRGCNLMARNGSDASAKPVVTCAGSGDITVEACILQSENPATAKGSLPDSVTWQNNVIGTYTP